MHSLDSISVQYAAGSICILMVEHFDVVGQIQITVNIDLPTLRIADGGGRIACHQGLLHILADDDIGRYQIQPWQSLPAGSAFGIKSAKSGPELP